MPTPGAGPDNGAVILLTAKQAAEARRMRRAGLSAEDISAAMGQPLDEVEKVLVQMRMPRPETTRGTLNVTLAAHRLIMRERQGDEPIWTTVDRLLDELLRLRTVQAAQVAEEATTHRRGGKRSEANTLLPLLAGLA